MGVEYSSKRESFHDAILKKDLKKVKYFIQNGLDVKNDLRALELATYKGSTDIVEYLLQRGCKPINKRTARAFDIAVWKCHKEIAQLFLKAGIEYKGKNIYQETILFVAACSNNTALTEILIESGCDMNETTRYWAPIHAAAARNHEPILLTLLKHGCDLDLKDKDGFTALDYCILNENFKCINYLIQCGCRINMLRIMRSESLNAQLIKYPMIGKILVEEVNRVKSLQEITRLKIRKGLGQCLLIKIEQLPLPDVLKHYLAMRDLFGFGKNSSSLLSNEFNPSINDGKESGSENVNSSSSSASNTIESTKAQQQNQTIQLCLNREIQLNKKSQQSDNQQTV